MGIFGQLDAANVKSNVYFIEQGEYEAEILDAKFNSKSDGQRQLIITYVVTDADSEYYEQRATQFFNLPDSDLTEEKLATLSAEDKQKIRKNNSAIKRALCGDARFKGLGVPENDLNDPNWNPEVLKGLKVTMGVSNYGQDGVNVRWANLRD